jgi:pilus assembly protein Flp/PilA
MKASVIRFIKEEDGITAIEYAVMAGLMVGILAVAFKGVTDALTTAFDNIANLGAPAAGG